MENYIPISYLNDFIFCPRSIYFHQLYGNFNEQLYQADAQVAGKLAHSTIDEHRYSTKQSILQGIEIYSSNYNLCGKIDTFDIESGELVERKKLIKTIYDGYIFQLYAQYYCLLEMGYCIHTIALYSLQDNKKYPVTLPENNLEMKNKFDKLLSDIFTFNLENDFIANAEKCKYCIYSNLCDKAAYYDDTP